MPYPNIVYILADDLGYGDVQALNPEGKIPTPNLDRLASEGRVFTNAHTPSAVCTPTRYGLLTGRYPWRTRLKDGVIFDANAEPLIDENTLTAPQVLKQAGYDTAMIGKWHLGMKWENNDWTAAARGGPVDHGFDSYLGVVSSLNLPPAAYVRDRHFIDPSAIQENVQVRGQTRTGPGDPDFDTEATLGDLTDEAVAYIQSRQGNDTPFFLYYPLTSPHTPILPTPEFQGASGINQYADFVMQTDAEVGRLLDALEATGQVDNTWVIFTADNGCAPPANFPQLLAAGHNPSAGMRGCKLYHYEGGHRVPFITRWPGRVPAGTQTSALICVTDFTRTVAELTGQSLPDDAGVDSFNKLPYFLGKGEPEPKRQYVVSQSFEGWFSIQDERWKLCFTTSDGGYSKHRYPFHETYPDSYETFQLYDLENDFAETTNVYADNPEVVQRLTQAMDAFVNNGRSTPGTSQENTGGTNWKQVNWR